jgi:hypothetical protein
MVAVYYVQILRITHTIARATIATARIDFSIRTELSPLHGGIAKW